MPATLPEPSQVLQAVQIYMDCAYRGDPPVAVKSMLAILQTWKGDFFRSPAIAADASNPPKRYTIRLGNSSYPHMKLAVELAPDGNSFLFKADTHDRHICPPETNPEYLLFMNLRKENSLVGESIDAAWETAGLPTFKSYLRDDLARRQAGE
jgi:hypothetical protein